MASSRLQYESELCLLRRTENQGQPVPPQPQPYGAVFRDQSRVSLSVPLSTVLGKGSRPSDLWQAFEVQVP